MSNKQVAVFYGDDASPEVMQPTVDLLRAMNLGIDFIEPLVGQAAKDATGTLFPDAAKAQIDAADDARRISIGWLCDDRLVGGLYV